MTGRQHPRHFVIDDQLELTCEQSLVDRLAMTTSTVTTDHLSFSTPIKSRQNQQKNTPKNTQKLKFIIKNCYYYLFIKKKKEEKNNNNNGFSNNFKLCKSWLLWRKCKFLNAVSEGNGAFILPLNK